MTTGKQEWHWRPDVPIDNSPVFAWPPKPVAALKWLARQGAVSAGVR